MIALDELKIPTGLRPVADEIVGITDSATTSRMKNEASSAPVSCRAGLSQSGSPSPPSR
jgi:hypothetical protein